MSEILLAKPQLPAGWIDCSVGEPHVVRQHLIEVFDLGLYELPKVPHMYEYPESKGYKPLIQLLEEKHKAPVVITNGAKQALGAVFYALKKLDRSVVEMRIPYWALIPPLLEMHGCTCVATMENPPHYSDHEFWKHDAHLYLGPNNPDGWIHPPQELIKMNKMYKDVGKPFIHDAAYYTPCYLPNLTEFPVLGDVQIHSISKMLGLSGIRVGYAVCPNPEFYKLITQYVEAMTVGVSITSQVFLCDLMNRMRSYPTLTQRFQSLSAMSLEESKKIVKQIDPEILEVPDNIESIPGMFGWFKVGKKADFSAAKINLINGDLFGVPGMVRMNLAFPKDQMLEIVNRLNSAKR